MPRLRQRIPLTRGERYVILLRVNLTAAIWVAIWVGIVIALACIDCGQALARVIP